MREAEVCLDLFLAWLAERHERRFLVDATEEPGLNAFAVSAAEGDLRLAVEVHSILEPTANAAWLAARDQLQQDLAAGLPGAYALWLPPGADLPIGADASADLLVRVREVAAGLGPGQRVHVSLSVPIFLRKEQEDGSLVSVSGGLNQHWARLSERVRGTYALDSTRLHRLPESEEHLQQLFELIWERAADIQPGRWAELETIDAWTLQRLQGGEGLTIIGRPPQEFGEDTGLTVRRNFRRLLAEAAPRLRARGADIRALVILGPYGRMEEEGATTAMRGYDPALYSGLEFVCLAADGLIKPLMEAPSGALRASGA